MLRLSLCCIVLSLTLSNAWGLASSSPPPMNCSSKQITWKDGSTILNTGESQAHAVLFYIHNKTQHQILINHPMMKDPSAKAGWGSLLDANHWSALLLNKRNFALNCARMLSGKMQMMNCAKTITVCESTITLNPAISGSYWYVENQTEKDLFAKVDARMKTVK